MPILTSVSKALGVQKQVKYSVSMSLFVFAFGIHLSTMEVDGMLKMNV